MVGAVNGEKLPHSFTERLEQSCKDYKQNYDVLGDLQDKIIVLEKELKEARDQEAFHLKREKEIEEEINHVLISCENETLATSILKKYLAEIASEDAISL